MQVILVSDACGQLVAELNPSRLETAVLPRSNNILMARYAKWNIGISLRERKRAFYASYDLHLKKDLAVEPRIGSTATSQRRKQNRKVSLLKVTHLQANDVRAK